MSLKTKLSLRLGIMLCGAVMAAGNANAVLVGEPAPALKISEWLKGQPVQIAGQTNKVFVIEFWATTCPPCVASIPHISELQEKYRDKGVVFINISAEEPDVVKQFIRRKGKSISYTVALDNDAKTMAAYISSFPSVAYPTAYIVDQQGRVVWTWTGYPMDDMERSLDAILAGNFDIELGKRRAEARQKLSAFFQMASTINDDERIQKMADEVETLDKEVGGIIPGKTFSAAAVMKEIRFQKALNEYRQAVLLGKPDNEIKSLDQTLSALAPPDFDKAGFVEQMNFAKTFDSYYLAVTGVGDTNQIPELTKHLAATRVKDSKMLRDFAWVIVSDGRVQVRDLALAATLAKASVVASDEKDLMSLHVYAQALFAGGKPAEAAIWGQKAVDLAQDDFVRQQLEAALKTYQDKVVK